MSVKKTTAAVELENQVRDIACLRWGVQASSEHIAGVNYDCILHLGEDDIIAVEATTQNNADKLRKDINDRLVHLKRQYQNSIAVVRCYFVMSQNPSPAMIEYGRSAGVHVMSIDQFRNQLLDFSAYVAIRSDKPFGSAVDPDTGKNDDLKYIPVKYIDDKGKEYDISGIVELLKEQKKIILLGEYGAGKSRCVHEIFNRMTCNITSNQNLYTFAINLRENWGLIRKTEILHRHFEDLGLSRMADSAVRISGSSCCCILLDGFDEIGRQSWSNDIAQISMTRRQSLKGIAEIIQSAKGGVLITGREQYFNSDEEMLTALGLAYVKNSVVVLRCPNEFTEAEIREYLPKEKKNVIDIVPEWIPRRPMIYNVLANIDSGELASLSKKDTSYRDYWNVLIRFICKREAGIRKDILDGDSIFAILKETAHLLILKGSDTAHISLEDLNKIYKKEIGISPDETSSVILQRLPGLGRISLETPDRIFTDSFLLDGLKASYFMDVIHGQMFEAANEHWGVLIGGIGYSILCDDYDDYSASYTEYLMKCTSNKSENHYLRGALVTIIVNSEEEFNFRNVILQNVNFLDAGLPIRLVSDFENLAFDSCILGELDITECSSTSLHINDCQIHRLVGVGGSDGKPSWIGDNCLIDSYQSDGYLSMLSRDEKLTTPQRVLLSLLKKIFFQPGHGRQESALKRGLNEKEQRYVQPIVELLKRENVVEQHTVNRKVIFSPRRTYMRRITRIRDELTLSKDKIWQEVCEMK